MRDSASNTGESLIHLLNWGVLADTRVAKTWADRSRAQDSQGRQNVYTDPMDAGSTGMMKRRNSVSVVIPTRNRRDKLEACVRSVEKSDYQTFEIVVVDDCSDERVGAALGDGHLKTKVIRNPVRRFLSYSRNLGATASSGDLIFFLDDDNLVAPATITELVGTFNLAPNVAVSCPVIHFASKPNAVWTSEIRKGRIPGFYVLGTSEPARPVRTFSFHNSFMVRRDVFNDLGGFDSQTFPIHMSEVDLAYRLGAKGYTAVVNPAAKVWHDVAESHMHIDSSRSFYTLRNRIILLKRYESARMFWAYVIWVLPALTAYYLAHHMLSSSEQRVLAAHNLLKGVIAALATRDVRLKPDLTDTRPQGVSDRRETDPRAPA